MPRWRVSRARWFVTAAGSPPMDVTQAAVWTNPDATAPVDVPVPFSLPLEDAIGPSEEKITAAIRAAMA